MTFKEYLDEAKQVGLIYHFTTLENAWLILSDMELVTDDSTDFNAFDSGFSLKRAREGVSFTRNKNLKITANAGGKAGKSWGAVRIVFDGDKMSNKYKFEPYVDTQNHVITQDDQREEIIKKPKVKLSKDMIKRVDVWLWKHIKDTNNFNSWCCVPDKVDRKKYLKDSKDEGEAFIQWLKDEGIKGKLVNNFK